MAKSAIRQRWDTTTDKADLRRDSDSEDNRAWVEAVSRPIPAYRAKLVLLAHGQAEISVTAIGQPAGGVAAWLIQGVKLGEKSFGAVNVEAPTKRWGGITGKWKADKLAGYLTKYIGKEFEEAEKSAKKYWASRNIEKPVITRFWLKANNFYDAAIEAHDLIFYRGMSLSMWGNSDDNVIWICGDTPRERLGKITEYVPDLDMQNN